MNQYLLRCASLKKIDHSFIQVLTKTLSLQKLKAETHFFEAELTLVKPPEEAKKEILSFSKIHEVDFILFPKEQSKHSIKLIVFDMDSTLIQQEVIDEMAKVHGIGHKVQAITERAMNGELNFDQSLTERVALLQGFDRSAMEKILSHLTLNKGVEKFIQEIKKTGCKTAIVSGGFRYFAESFRKKLDMDYVFANELEWNDHHLTGKVHGKIVNAQEKARLLEELAQKHHLSLHEVAAVGDGANDIPMLLKAGLGVAYHAKEKVNQVAQYHINYGPMTTLLYYLGIPGNHFDETL